MAFTIRYYLTKWSLKFCIWVMPEGLYKQRFVSMVYQLKMEVEKAAKLDNEQTWQ